MFVNTFAKSWNVDPEQIYKMLTVNVFAHTSWASHQPILIRENLYRSMGQAAYYDPYLIFL